LTHHQFHIILAGAGPGDPDLVTVKLVNALKEAEIILIDRLVNPEIISRYANPEAVIIPVGKQGYHRDSISQEEINKLLVESARTGKKTLRLKGGDVAIYSNVLSEIDTLKKNQISFEIIPGITAASGAAASLNIPLTARDLASGVQFHTLSSGNKIPDSSLQHWADSQDTLVFYMSIAPLKELLTGLLKYKADPRLPLVVIEEATTPAQKVSLFNLQTLLAVADHIKFNTPALVIIGRILESLDLPNLPNGQGAASIFDSLITPSINTELHVI